MKIINEKGKLFGIINLVDLFVLILIVVLAVYGIQKVTAKNPEISVATKPIVMTLIVPEVRDVTANVLNEAAQKNEITKDTDKNIVIGKIVKCEKAPAIRQVDTDDGRVINAEVPDRYDVTITIEADAAVSTSSINIGDDDIRIGSYLKLKGLKFGIGATIMSIDIKE